MAFLTRGPHRWLAFTGAANGDDAIFLVELLLAREGAAGDAATIRKVVTLICDFQ
jgi:hypothetical protein